MSDDVFSVRCVAHIGLGPRIRSVSSGAALLTARGPAGNLSEPGASLEWRDFLATHRDCGLELHRDRRG